MKLFRSGDALSNAVASIVEPLEGRQLMSSATISGRVYLDLNGDGRQKGKTEKGVPAVTVYLDVNDNQALDAGDFSVVTNSKGNFKIKGVPRTVQHVRAVFPDGYVSVTPPGGAWFADATRKKSISKQNFGLWPTAQGSPPIPDKTTPTPTSETPTSIDFYNSGALDFNNPDGTNSAPKLGGTSGTQNDPYWSVRLPAPLDANGVATGDDNAQPFGKTYFAFDGNRYNADLQPTSSQIDSFWIGPEVEPQASSAPGKYVFSTAFDLTGLEPSTAELSGAAIGDDRITDVRINGVSVGLSGAIGQVVPLVIKKGFIPGINTLQFVVENATAGPVGIRVDALRGTAMRTKAGPISFFNTGVGANNGIDGSNAVRLPGGAIEPHWQVSVPGAGYAFYTNDSAHRYIYNNALTNGNFGAAFVASDSTVWSNADLQPATAGIDSSFINPTGRAGDLLPAGTYIYRTTFDLTGVDSNTAVITGSLMASGNVLDMYINGNPTGQGIGAGYTPESKKTFTIDLGMVSGLNVLDIVVKNTSAVTTGIRVDGLRGTATGSTVRSTIAYPLRLPLPSFAPLAAPIAPLPAP